MATNITRAIIEQVLGPVSSWENDKDCVRFRPKYRKSLTLAQLTELSIAVGTDKINFDFGYSGEPGYSEYTPSSPGEPGMIEILK